MINIHTHTFNQDYTPENFLKLYVPVQRLVNILRPLLKIGISKWLLIKLLRYFGGANYSKYAAFLKIGTKKTQDMIFDDLRKSGYPGNARFVVLPLNFDHMGAGEVQVPYEQQLQDLIDVRRKFPNQCLPFVFIDPRMGTSLENKVFVEKWLNKGCVGIKLYPSLGYYPFDPRLSEVYKFAEKNKVPILTHCSSTGIFYNDPDNIPADFKQPKSLNPLEHEYFNPHKPKTYTFDFSSKPSKFTDNFLIPENYADVLLQYPKLKFCFAHFGLDNDQISNDKGWHDQILELIADFDNVYADISYTLYWKPYLKRINSEMQANTRLLSRVLFGTDYFMTVQERPEFDLYYDSVDFFGHEIFNTISVLNNESYLNSKFY